ncbi:hypothetical protein ACFO0N_09685 [Halobium salinum]|uniref:Uncharacterized protein n=1 Tax=Halobium salinum TaxID=1364940 RepID=A0ABD5PBE8_9EURY|nr:hypothetical protein [Halobium salinum]
MKRRTALGAAGLLLGSGCLGDASTPSESISDSDGDGVIDSQDYAPKDPNVSEKADLSSPTTSGTPITTARPTTQRPTTTTEYPTTETATRTTVRTPPPTTAVPHGNTLSVDSHPELGSQVVEYGYRSVTARIDPDGPAVEDTLAGESAKLVVGTYRYPDGDAVAFGESEPVTLSETKTLSVEVEYDASIPRDTRLNHLGLLIPGEKSIDEVESSEVAHFHETDPFVVDENNDIERSLSSDTPGDDAGETYERRAIEGAYSLDFQGVTLGRQWSVNFFIYKRAYEAAVQEPRGRSRSEYVTYAREEGFGREVASILVDEITANGFTDKREQVEFVIDFVQGLPYVPDEVSKGYDDYTKFLSETLVEAGGDCEDSAILLTSVLQSEPFGYDMVLFELPGHMAAGIYGSDDMTGTYVESDGRRYYYIETTGTGWGVGDIPETYQDERVWTHQV